MSWRGSTRTSDHFAPAKFLRHPWVPFSIIQVAFWNAPSSGSSLSTFIHLRFVTLSFPSSHNSEKEKPSLGGVAAVAMTPDFAVMAWIGWHSYYQEWVWMGDESQTILALKKFNPGTAPCTLPVVRLELCCYNSCFSCSSLKYYSWVQHEYTCLERL